MNRYFALIMLVFLLGVPLFAKGAMGNLGPMGYQRDEEAPVSQSTWEYDYVEYVPIMILAAAGDTDVEIPMYIRNNKYFLESVRLTNLANQFYEEGDYDASYDYSEEAIRYANLSDEYIYLQLRIKECDDAIAIARRNLDLAASMDAAARYPSEYSRALASFAEARDLRAVERWDDAIAVADRVLNILAIIMDGPGSGVLPAQYTVRPWVLYGDCLWDIAGRPWVYNDSRQWRVLYDANKTNMPEPNNPDLILIDMILNIPSLRGEERQGMWDANATYPTFSR